jgi:hypothetical protein
MLGASANAAALIKATPKKTNRDLHGRIITKGTQRLNHKV